MSVTEFDPEIGLAASRRPVAQLHSVSMSFGDNTVLHDLDLQVNAGEIVALIGRSGSGKSTSLRLLAGLSEPSHGGVETDGPPAVAFQEPRLFPWRRVAANVGYGLNRLNLPAVQREQRVNQALTEVGLADKANAWPLTLSGGQAQRVSLARALVAEPNLLLLDEPFGALDALTRRSMHDLLLSVWQRHRFGVLLVTHDVEEAVLLADQVVVLEHGQIVHSSLIELSRPRDRADIKFSQHVAELLDALGVG